MQAHQHTPPFIFLAPAYIGVPSPSFSLYPRQVPAVYLSKQKKKGARICFVGFVSFFYCFGLPCNPFFLHPVHPHLFRRLPMTKGHDHTLSTYLSFFVSPSVVHLHICFSSLLSLCTSGSLWSLRPLRVRWTLKAHGTLTECQPTPQHLKSPRTDRPTVSRHLNEPATARRSNAISDATAQAKGTGLFIPPQRWGFDFGWAEEIHR